MTSTIITEQNQWQSKQKQLLLRHNLPNKPVRVPRWRVVATVRLAKFYKKWVVQVANQTESKHPDHPQVSICLIFVVWVVESDCGCHFWVCLVGVHWSSKITFWLCRPKWVTSKLCGCPWTSQVLITPHSSFNKDNIYIHFIFTSSTTDIQVIFNRLVVS